MVIATYMGQHTMHSCLDSLSATSLAPLTICLISTCGDVEVSSYLIDTIHFIALAESLKTPKIWVAKSLDVANYTKESEKILLTCISKRTNDLARSGLPLSAPCLSIHIKFEWSQSQQWWKILHSFFTLAKRYARPYYFKKSDDLTPYDSYLKTANFPFTIVMPNYENSGNG